MEKLERRWKKVEKLEKLKNEHGWKSWAILELMFFSSILDSSSRA